MAARRTHAEAAEPAREVAAASRGDRPVVVATSKISIARTHSPAAPSSLDGHSSPGPEQKDEPIYSRTGKRMFVNRTTDAALIADLLKQGWEFVPHDGSHSDPHA
jgi:hypothetical protein